jgi:hypothetical protein
MRIKGGLSVKSNSYLITFNNADPKGSAFEMLKGVKETKPKPLIKPKKEVKKLKNLFT